MTNTSGETNDGPPSEAESAGEEPKRNTEFKELFDSEAFKDGYVERQTADKQKVVDAVDKKIDTDAKRIIAEPVNEKARELGGYASVAEGQADGKKWGQLLGQARGALASEVVPVEVLGVASTIPWDKFQENARGSALETNRTEYDEAQQGLVNAQSQARTSIQKIGAEFVAALDQPDFQNTLDAWGEAPALDKSIQHSGLVHFIDYRSDKAKDRLHKVPEAFSPDGFKEYTARVMSYVDNPTAEGIKESLHLADASGKERMLIMTQDEQYVSAFRNSNAMPWQIITHVPDMADKQWQKTKTTMQDAAKQARYYNKLEGDISVVASHSAE